MTTVTDSPPLSVGARRRALCELADLYTAEQPRANRPITEGLPAMVPGLCGDHISVVDALDLFDRFARERAELGRADATHGQMAAGESHAERLLNELVGGQPW